jgi:RNA polymerase sigma factor (TIGR02999 family)
MEVRMADGEQSKSASAPKRVSATGDGRIANRVFSRLYDELHCVAARELRSNAAAALSPTTLLHETFLNVSQRRSAEFADRSRFMAYAARAMRGLIIDHLRYANRRKRGRELEVDSLSDILQIEATVDIEVSLLRDALEALATIDQRLAECVDLKFFCGFSFLEIAQLWNVSERTVLRDWDKARILLNRLVSGAASDAPQLS